MMHPADLETIVARELARLPLPRAPRTLLPQVLAAAVAWRRRPWYTRAWLTWPPGWQAASLVAFLLVVAGVATVLPVVQSGMLSAVGWVTAAEVASDTMAGLQRAATAAGAARIVWDVLVEPIALYMALLAGLLYLTCVALGLLLGRVALGKALMS